MNLPRILSFLFAWATFFSLGYVVAVVSIAVGELALNTWRESNTFAPIVVAAVLASFLTRRTSA